jgi:CheY-like chemotaxis protein
MLEGSEYTEALSAKTRVLSWLDSPSGSHYSPPARIGGRGWGRPRGGTLPSGRLILVVDDEKAIRELLCRVLTIAGYEVEEAADGYEALERVARRRPDLILLDLMMPLMDGCTFLQELRASARLEQVPVLVLTAAGPHWEYPISDVLHKPVDADDLVAAVQRVLAEHAAAPGNADPQTESCAREGGDFNRC